MRVPIVLAAVAALNAAAVAQSVPRNDPPRVRRPGEPAGLPAGGAVPKPGPDGGDPTVTLPAAEARVPIDPRRLAVVKSADGWRVQCGPGFARDFGPDMGHADEARRAIRESVVTDWVAVGSPRPGVEYGLTAGKAAVGVPRPKYSLPLDPQTAGVEQVRGVWVLRDGAAVLANFGPRRADADQALAAAKRYGFNRVGYVGFPAPVFTYFYTDPAPADLNQTAPVSALLQSAAAGLTRTGVPVPGTGAFVGERVVIEARKVAARQAGTEYVVGHGPDVLARFGRDEWAARDAARVVQDLRPTEFCTVAGVGFYLVNGAAPTRVPFAARTTPFDPAKLKPTPAAGGVGLADPAGRVLFTVPTDADAADLVRVLRGYGFDTVCQTGATTRSGLRFLAKTGR